MRAAAAAVADITSLTLTVAGSGPTYTITRSAGSFISDGIRVGMCVRVTAGLLTANKNRNLLVTTLTALIMTVYPVDGSGLTAESSVASCTVNVPGKRIYIPSTGHLERSYTVEDLISATQSRQFTGCEFGQVALDCSPGKNATATWNVLGKQQTLATSGYFVSPGAQSSSGLLSGPRGVVLVGGSVQTVVTGLQFTLNGNLSTEPVVGSTYAPSWARALWSARGSCRCRWSTTPSSPIFRPTRPSKSCSTWATRARPMPSSWCSTCRSACSLRTTSTTARGS
jgi:hypothetical protein